MAKKSHHVVPDPKGGWNVKEGGAKRASKHFDKKDDAVDWGRDVSKRAGTSSLFTKRMELFRRRILMAMTLFRRGIVTLINEARYQKPPP